MLCTYVQRYPLKIKSLSTFFVRACRKKISMVHPLVFIEDFISYSCLQIKQCLFDFFNVHPLIADVLVMFFNQKIVELVELMEDR